MSQKTIPKSLRVKNIEDWLSRGFYKKNFPRYLKEDFEIRRFLEKKLPKGVVEKTEIERSQTSLKIIIKTSRPALVIGRGGEGVERLRKEIIKIVGKEKSPAKKDVKIEIITVRNPWTSASLVSQWVASQLEKRMPYRRALKMALQKVIILKEVKGVKILVSGRLNGVSISRSEWLKEGELPRQTQRAVIDYGFSQAHCTYGVIGVKVWIYKGERFGV